MARAGDTAVLIYAAPARPGAPLGAVASLPDPRTGEPASFIVGPSSLLEVNYYKARFSSWFVGDGAVSNGGLRLATPLDPLLLALPLLDARRARGGLFVDPETLLEGAGAAAPALGALLAGGGCDLACLCDVRAEGGARYFRLSDDRTLAWLRLKTARAEAALLACEGAAFGGLERRALAAYAAGLVAEWLPPGWAARLHASLGLPDPAAAAAEAAAAARAAAAAAYTAGPPPAAAGGEKRPRLDPKERQKAAARAKAQEEREAKKRREAAGMRKLSSFFGGGGGGGKK